MIKRSVLLLGLILFCTASLSEALWHCTATNSEGAVWNWFGSNHEDTRLKAEKQCLPFNNHVTCNIICFPPKVYWRCMARDTLPLSVNHNPGTSAVKQGKWYWVSYSKQIAINGARDACRHNSAFGGCYVDQNACASS